jgi:hypothetical protein
MTLENVTHESLTENLHTQFRVTVESGEPFELELIEVSEKRRVRDTENFSAIFRGGLGFLLQQCIHHLEHERLGELDLFLVPIAREADGFRYEAIFNRVLPEAQD